MLEHIRLKFGETQDRPPLTIPVGSAVVLVGPNNSGKSRLLQEIEQFLKGEARWRLEYLLLKDIEPEVPRNPALRQALVTQIKQELPQVAFLRLEEPLDFANPDFKWLDLKDLSKAMDLLTTGKLVLTPHAQILIDKLKSSFGSLWALFESAGALNSLKEIEQGVGEKLKAHQGEAEQVLYETLKAGIRLIEELRKNTQERGAEEAILDVVRDGRIRIKPYLSLVGPRTIRLDGRQRLEHVRPTSLPTWDSEGNNVLTRLLRSPSALKALRDIVHEAFEYYLSIDVSSFQRTEFRLSSEHPQEHELAPLKPDALEYFKGARRIEEFSDGVKSFVGLLSAVLSDEYLVMLIDEPEAFLHPPLARRLGQKLHEISRERGAHVLAATHSADFLMGCLQAAPDVNIVRLTYRQGVPTARLLPSRDLRQMMLDPLLRSTGTLSALFHEGAIVCEGDSDRAFYQEINERLLKRKEGADGCLFMNAHSKQAIHRVVGMLRRMGIPAAAIVDLDIIIDENTLKDLLTAIGADSPLINSLGMIKGQFYKLFVPNPQDKEEGKKNLKTKGLRALDEKNRASMRSLFFGPLAQHGIFVVPEGELESWLAPLLPAATPTHKSEWLNTIFEALGSDPNGKYVHPGKGDVWDFMRSIAEWIENPARNGMPSS